jgi:hypothetical protein
MTWLVSRTPNLELAAKYKIKVICAPIILLGMHITRNYENHTIRLSQTHYIHQILKEFNMGNAVSMTMGPTVRSNGRFAIDKQNEISKPTYIQHTSVNCWMQHMLHDPIYYT